MDAKSAFLNGVLQEESFDQPEGFVITNVERKVYKLEKCLVWFETST